MINLFITYSPDKWDKSPAFIENDRALTEYILPSFQEQYSSLTPEAIEELKRIPCLFAYERKHRKDIAIGRITNIIPQQRNIRIDFTLSGQSISFVHIDELSDILDMDPWEWNRTHWTIKTASLSDLQLFVSGATQRNPAIFISYSWSPPSNQRNVMELIQKLKDDGIIVKYDKDYLYPGQDMNYFMERELVSKNFDAIVIICNSDYATKANNRSGGVGYESGIIITQIRNDPLQTRYIPVAIEHNIDGSLPLPSFLASRYCIDLTQEDGYKELLKAIRRCHGESLSISTE